jgi:hypothetical protein
VIALAALMRIHGDVAAADSRWPASRSATSVARVGPPPAESPAMATLAGSWPAASSQR